MLYVSVHVLYSSYFMNNGGGDAVAPGRGFVVAVQNQNIVPRLGVFLYMGGFADGCKEGEYTGNISVTVVYGLHTFF